MALLDGLRERIRRTRSGRPEEENGMADPLDALARQQTAEEAEAYQRGQRIGAAGLVSDSRMKNYGADELAAGGKMTPERLNKATETLIKYQAGKASVDARVISAQQWWKMKNWPEISKDKGTKGSTARPSSTGWLWNAIIGKHADAIDSYPEPVILPRMMDDQEEAENLSAIIPVVMEMNDFEETYNDCSWQKMQEGTGVYGVFWNSSKLNGLGDIDIRKVNILNLFWEPGISDIQESRNVFFVTYEDKEDMEAMYPQLKGKLKTNKLAVKRYRTDDNVDMEKQVPVIDWYYKVRQGENTVLHYCKFVGETSLYCSEEMPDTAEAGFYADGMYPFVLDPLYPVEGSPAGYGMIDIAKDTQSDIDTLNQAMVRNAAMRATPRYFMRKDAGLNEDEFADWSKPIVHTNGNLGTDQLRPVEVNQMGSDAHNMLQQKIDEIKTITGNMDVNNGGVPSGVTAASAIAALKEDSGRSSKDSTKAAYRSYRKIVIMVIERIRQFYDIPRMFRITGEQAGQQGDQFVKYSNSGLKMQEIPNLQGQEPGLRLPVFDIEVRAQRENAYTKMSQNELAIQFYQLGLMNPQAVDQALMVLGMMDFRGKDRLMQKLQAQGTMQQTLMQVAQIAMALAQRYQPEMAEQLAGIVQGVAADAGMQPALAAGGGKRTGIAGKTAPDDPANAPREANENPIVSRARERSANASRPD